MAAQCPECKKRLEEFSVHCDHCGWSLVEAAHRGSVPDEGFAVAFDLLMEQTLRLIDQGDLSQASSLVERAVGTADSDHQRGEAAALRGYIRLKKGDPAGAETDCRSAIQLGYEDHRVQAWLAAALGQQNRWPEAVDVLARAGTASAADERRFAGFLLNYLQRANAWYEPQLANGAGSAALWLERGWVRLRCGDRRGAADDLNRALDLEPASHRALLGLAEVALHRREYRQAADLASRALCSVDPSLQRDALVCRARALHNIGQTVEWRQDERQLRKLAGRDPALRLAAARLRGELGELSLALGDLRALVEEFPGMADAWWLKGRYYARLGNHRTAIARFSEACRLRPADARILVDLGASQAALGKTSYALQSFQRARELDPQLADAWLGQARMHAAAQDFPAALAAVTEALSRDDHRADSYGIRGQIRFGLCEYREAVEDFSRAIDLAGDRNEKADWHYRRGTALHELGDFDGALADFVAASQLVSGNVGTWVWRAAVHARLQRWNEAVADLQQVMRFRSDQARSYLTLARPVAQRCVEYFSRRIQRSEELVPALHRSRGLAHEFLGNTFQAIEDFRTVLGQERGEPTVALRLARLLQKLDQHPEAIRVLTHVIHRDRDNHAARYARAISHSATGDGTRALSDAIKAIHAAPGIARYRLLRGELRIQKGDFERGLADMNEAIWLDSSDPAGWQMRGELLRRTGDLDGAARDLSRAIDLSGEPVDLLARRGQVLLDAGNPAAALADFDRCLRKNPAFLPAVMGRAMALGATGRPQEALLWLTKSLHRFSEPLDVARILLTRGKVFYRMGAGGCAVTDFTSVLHLISGDLEAEHRARYARALAHIQAGKFEAAEKDLRKVIALAPRQESAQRVMQWLADRNRPQPAEVHRPARLVRMERPRILRTGIPSGASGGADPWRPEEPWDTWIVRNDEEHEYGPVPKATLDRWVEQGRITAGMKLLRGDWSKWKRAERVYAELTADRQAV